MKILWLTWKDRQHPQAGGAEVVNEELAKRLTADGHEVIFIVGGFKDATPEEVVSGYKIIRLGNRYSVYWQAYRYYKKHLEGWADLVIDEVNTVPFFAKFYVKERNVLLVYQLARQIWFYQMIFPLSLVGYLVEPIYLWLLRDRQVLTESMSTKKDLMKYGFKANKINIFNIGIELEPIKSLSAVKKYSQPTLLSLGAIRPMKRTLDQIKAFEIAKKSIPNLQLVVAGDSNGGYGKRVLNRISRSPYVEDIKYLGKINKAKKIELLQKCHLVLATPVKEGWGLIVTEAASQGTPAVVYDVDGLRDSVRHKQTGRLCKHNTPANLAENIMALINDRNHYTDMRKNACEWSKSITFDASYKAFKKTLSI